MTRLLGALLLALALIGCNPPAPLEGSPQATFVLLGADGEELGRAQVSTLGAGLVLERTRLDDGTEQRVELSDAGALVVSLTGQAWREGRLLDEGDRWRFVGREGLVLEERAFPREEGDLVGAGGGIAGGLGASLASWWRSAPTLLASGDAVDTRFVDAANGRALPMRIEPRGALEVEVDGRPMPARRFYAWTSASGIGLVASVDGALLAVEGVAGARAVRSDAKVPPPPLPPLPAGVREERFVLEDALGRFDAALTVPAGATGPLPGVLLLPGSGPADLDGNFGGGMRLDLYRRLAGALSAEGIAVLRYDKPGIEKASATDDPASAAVPDVEDLLVRAASALAALEQRPEVAAGCLFLVGHSEGGMLAPELALRERARVVGLVLLASPARELFAVLEDQLVAFLAASGASEEEIAEAQAYQRALLRLLRYGRDVELPGDEASAAQNAWLKSHLDRSPAKALAALDVPVLAVFGAEDVQVLDETEVEPMKEALAHLADAEVVVVPDMDHLLMPASPFVGPGRYADPGRRYGAFVVDDIPRWIVSRACPSPAR